MENRIEQEHAERMHDATRLERSARYISGVLIGAGLPAFAIYAATQEVPAPIAGIVATAGILVGINQIKEARKL